MSRVGLLSLAALLACARAYEDAARKPARTVDDDNAATLVIGELGKPLHVPCLESEDPTLFVFWYRGHGKGKLLKNGAVYQMRRNAFVIRSLAIKTLGPYTCQAYNSEDMKPPRMFVVRVNMPDETSQPESDWLVPRSTGAPSPGTRLPTSAETSTTTMTTTEAPGLWFTDKSELAASEGGTLTLRCNSDVPWFHDNPSPKITWKLGELIIDGNEGRYRLISDGALEIVSLYRNDTGVYICVADYGLGVATQEIHLVVNGPVRMPAGIAGDENAVVTGELGSPLEVRCLAYGYPPPSVFWYSGFDKEAIVLYSDMEYETRGNLLTIKRLNIDSLGEYQCRAYNGVGQPASWKVVVRAYKREGLLIENELLLPRDIMAPRPGTEPPTTVDTTTTTTLRTTEAPRLLVSETSTAGGYTETTENTARASEVETSTHSTTNEGTSDVIGTNALDPCSSFEFGCCADNETEASGSDGQGCPCNATKFGCCADGVSPGEPVRMPAGISGAENAWVISELYRPFQVCCSVYGDPQPSVEWYRSNERNTLLHNDTVYEPRGNVLLIRRLKIEYLGTYTCKACNGVGQPALWKVVVRAYTPAGLFYGNELLLVSRHTVAPSLGTQCLTTADTTTTTTLRTTEAPRLLVSETSTAGGYTETTENTARASEVETSTHSTTNEGTSDVIGTTALDPCSSFEFGCCADNETEASGPDGQGCPCNATKLGCCPDGVSPEPVMMPAGISGGENAWVIGELHRPFQVCCSVYGDPQPSVEWYRSNERNTLLHNDTVYEPRGNVLLIRRLKIEYLGTYTCKACNGVGQPALWKVVVRAYTPAGLFYGNELLLVSRHTVAPSLGTQCLTTADTTTTTTLRTTEAPRLLVSENTASEVETGTPSTTNEGTTDVIGTTTLDPCSSFEFGCCADNETEASGPDGQGCPCNATEFGCCPDGVTPVAGREGGGCTGPCSTSRYGCCQDDKTPAHGPDFVGCCLLQVFRCCPDNRKSAEGPHFEGCGCQYTLHGCCLDNVTNAQGPGNQGCGCQYTEHGCCPDRHTAASGPNNEGCTCNTYQFGCCADGVTTAMGPEQQGCHCRKSKFGCCGDGKTPATGPDGVGCDCSSSRHGCCPDGRTEATGAKFLGCTDAPENKQAACSMSTDLGPCHNFTAMWYYDLAFGDCSQFWYGGCDGNGNRFSSKEECEDVCVQPSPKGQCNLPIDQGSCAGNYSRWGFNSEAHRCEQFIWGGCEGNSNRFSSEAACQMRCAGTQPPQCTQPQDAGKCTEKEALWSFSQSENRCLPFYYSGCGGNGNRFISRDACEQTCPSAYVADKCTLPAETGQCSNYRERWFYDTTFKRCRQFYYGGCGGNENNFGTGADCDSSCSEIKTTTTTTTTTTTASPVEPQPEPRPHVTDQRPAAPDRSEFCFNAIDAGPCNNTETRHAYDSELGRCVTFQYGGCGGNQNNFPDEDYCSSYCQPMQDICQLPMLQGPCDDSLMRWFYDSTTDSCSQFTYGGCDGNDNRFESLEACESRCRTGPAPVEPSTPTTTVIVDGPPECIVPEALEDCRYGGVVWFFDPSLHECVSYANQEAGPACRHTGTFSSQEACERSCGAFRGVDVCKQRLDAGPCLSNDMKIYFDPSTGQCHEFAYGGCLGGPNRFSSIQECLQVCKSEIGRNNILPQDCTPYRQQCEALECQYGVESFTENGCQRCICRKDPCVRANCQPTERCEAFAVRNPASQEPMYSARCVAETTEVYVDCDEYVANCSRLSCEYGVQRARLPDGCEKCSCVQVEIDCEPLRQKCNELKCRYEVERIVGTDGCESCECIKYPCERQSCGAGERCSVQQYVDGIKPQTKFAAVCRTIVKAGACPKDEMTTNEVTCQHECGDDADCRGVGKCCRRGCSNLCLVPVEQTSPLLTTTVAPNVPAAPLALPQPKPEVEASEGGSATLRCLLHGNPPPKITWTFGELTIDGNADRYRLMSDGALQIVFLYRNDTGVYICVADNGLGVATQEVHLVVNDPVRMPVGIAGDENAVVIGELGSPLEVRCLAYGYPPPSVFWYSGYNEAMVPYNNAKYSVRGNSLLIRSLAIETLGQYTCQAYNGEGKAASWVVFVRAYQPEEYLIENDLLVPRNTLPPRPRIQPPTTGETNTTTTTTTEAPRPLFTVLVSTHVSTPYSTLNSGADLRLSCDVDGFPEPDVHWTKDGATIQADGRITITGSTIVSRLKVARVSDADSGLYACHASNQYSSQSDNAQINVKQLVVPAKCTDNPFFADCGLIVRSNFCKHSYFSKFCCKSCVEAGLLDPQDVELQAN